MNLDSDLDPSFSLKPKGSKLPLIIGIAVALVGAGAAGFLMTKTQNDRKVHAAFMERFAGVEHGEVAAFWQCLLGPKIDAATFPDNLALGQRITAQFGVDAKTYPQRVGDECVPHALTAKKQLGELGGPSLYSDALASYQKSLDALADAFTAWSKVAPAQVAEMQLGKQVETFGTAWHAFGGGKPGDDVIAYDNFLRCAVPSLDKMKDGQALVEYLFAQCKNPAYDTRIDTECGKLIMATPPAAPAKTMVATMRKLAADDREMKAFDDCLRKARKGQRRDDTVDIGRGWVAWMEARQGVRKIGQEALKE